jgi:hypothetical protein
MSEFTETNGVKLPTKTVVTMGSQKIMQMDVSERIINGTIAPDAFDKPTP